MTILGFSYFGSLDTVAVTPTDATKDTYVAVRNAVYDNVYITRDVTSPLTDPVPEEWDVDTILYAKFDYGLNAGNLEYSTDTLDTMLLKRREQGTFKWITIYVKPVGEEDDLNINGYDYYNAAKTTYEYAVVPVYQGIEGKYNIYSVESDFAGLFVAEKDKVYGAENTNPENRLIYGTEIDAAVDYQRNAPSATVELINAKYPKYVSNSIANYDSGTAKGEFVLIECPNTYYDLGGYPFRKAILDFLTDKKPKILKYETGKIWMINVTGAPTNTGKDELISFRRDISFEWVEVGDYLSERDLYYSGLSDIPSEYWSNNS